MRNIGAAMCFLTVAVVLLTGCSKSDDSKGSGSKGTAVATAAAGTVAGAGTVATAVNSSGKGGSTTCAAFNGYSKSQQEEAVTDMLKEEGKKVTKMEVSTTRISAVAFCKTSGKDSSVIRQIHTG